MPRKPSKTIEELKFEARIKILEANEPDEDEEDWEELDDDEIREKYQ